MKPDHAAHIIILALRNGFVTREQMAAAAADLAPGGTAEDLGVALERRGFLPARARRVLDDLVQARTAAGPENPREVRADEQEMLSLLDGLPRGPEALETLLEWTPPPRPSEPPDSAALRDAFQDEVLTIDDSRIPAAPSGEPARLRQIVGTKYEFRKELGRGGLGRVMEALDRDFGREVAVKLMLPGRSDAAVERFLREGRAAGMLAHPNIIPVYEIGALRAEGGETPYFTMTKILGRDLSEIVRALALGDPGTTRTFSRHRLLQVFQEVCNAMAYAHDHGVIHRDLKPSNIMVGDYGEVFVVDWGLAKILGESDAPEAQGREPETGRDAALTLEGQVMGTPAYMPPEQAEGRTADIDARSDIYSLGAILYELLTYQPPFEGASAREVISRVLTEDVLPPSQRLTRTADPSDPLEAPTLEDRQYRAGRAPLPGLGKPVVAPAPVPAALDDIVMHALARDREARFASIQDLRDEIQAFLEGEKERARAREKADECLAEGRGHASRMEAMRDSFHALSEEAQEKGRTIRGYWPVEKKKDYWALQDKVRALRIDMARTFSMAESAFQSALSFVRGHAEARAALADLYWARFLREEAKGDEEQMAYFETLVREYNDGQYDDLLRGDGTLTVTTRSYPCSCLLEGRTVGGDALEVAGHHPVSGRFLGSAPGTEGLTELEPTDGVLRKVHGPTCTTEPLSGAHAWLFRHEERDKRLVPSRPPRGGGSGTHVDIPPATLDALFGENSPFRPGPGLYLGRTPVATFTLPMGSYLLILACEGYAPVRVPVLVERQARESADVVLYRTEEIPAGFVPIAGGRFIAAGDLENPFSGPREDIEIPDFFLARFPVTCAEYLAYLNELSARDRDLAWKRAPRESERTGQYWPLDDEGRFHLPTREWLDTAPPDLKDRARELTEATRPWEAQWPVFGISWEDAVAYAAWRTEQSGRLHCLPPHLYWEKAARGTDGRYFPWGDTMDAGFCNISVSHEEGMHPEPVDSFPTDESPFGVRGLGGNMREPCLGDEGGGNPGRTVFRGGAWTSMGVRVRSSHRMAMTTTHIGGTHGVRLAWLVRMPPA